jgi:tRNA threonylcarbamoyl adenosine modification protein YeaZ
VTGFMLAIDTTAGTSVALLSRGSVLSEVRYDNGMKHAELIGDAIAQVFAKVELEPQVVDVVAVGRGPALFTGLRVGIAAGVMLAEAVGARLMGVISHDALALETYSNRLDLADGRILVVTDARRGEIYWALYDGIDAHGIPVRVAGPAVGKHDEVTAALAEYGQFTEVTGGATAHWVARLAEAQLMAGLETDEVSALYLRAPDAVEPKPNQMFGKRVSG